MASYDNPLYETFPGATSAVGTGTARDSRNTEKAYQPEKKKPKKMAKRNAFFMFMMERKPQLVAEGHQFPGGWKDVANFVDAEWQSMPAHDKEKYNEKADRYNGQRTENKSRAPPGPGQTLVEEDLPKPQPGKSPAILLQERKMAEYREIREKNRSIVTRLFYDDDWKQKSIVVCYFSLFLGEDGENVFIPAELGLVAFNLEDGIVDNYGRLIIPKKDQIPDEWATEFSKTGKKLCFPELGTDDTSEFEDLDSLMENFQQFLWQYRSYYPSDARGQLYVFALDSDFERVYNCLSWLNNATGERRINILSLNLWAHMASTTRAQSFRSIPIQLASFHMRAADSGENEILDYEKLSAKVASNREPAKPLNPCFTYPHGYPLVEVGIFAEEQHVEQTIKEMDNYRYYEELCCMYHNKKGEGIHHCALLMANRYVYGVLEVITMSNETTIIPAAHFPEAGTGNGNVQLEWNRRQSMLERWGLTEYEKRMPKEDPTVQLTAQFSALNTRKRLFKRGGIRGGMRGLAHSSSRAVPRQTTQPSRSDEREADQRPKPGTSQIEPPPRPQPTRMVFASNPGENELRTVVIDEDYYDDEVVRYNDYMA